MQWLPNLKFRLWHPSWICSKRENICKRAITVFSGVPLRWCTRDTMTD